LPRVHPRVATSCLVLKFDLKNALEGLEGTVNEPNLLDGLGTKSRRRFTNLSKVTFRSVSVKSESISVLRRYHR